MPNPEPAFEPILNALPGTFDFYHLGRVEPMARAIDEPMARAIDGPMARAMDELTAIGFRVQGERRHTLIVLFDRDLDVSAYTEMANVIASRLATRLEAADGTGYAISPPLKVSPARLRQILTEAPGERISCRTYRHVHEGRSVEVHVLVLLSEKEELGNA